MEHHIEINDSEVKKLLNSLRSIMTQRMMRDICRSVGINVREHFSDHIARASVSRHKSADSLGAEHTKYLEFAVARGQMRSESDYSPKDGEGKPFIEVQDVNPGSVAVVIGNTPGLERAFGPMTITPKRARALTIPINKIAYGRSVKEVEDKGFDIFHPKGTRILAASDGKDGVIPLFVLCGKVTIPQDTGLLPTENEIEEWSADSIEAFLETLVK